MNLRQCREWWQSAPTFFRLIAVVLVLRSIGAVLHCIAPITSPHTWRQVDTMATALRYARRWTVEQLDFAWWIPAVLNSRNTRGIMPMEFPLVDMWGALGFVVAGPDIDLGRSMAQALLLLLVVVLICAAGIAWRLVPNAPKGMDVAAVFAAVFAFAGPYTAKFMPDTSAMLFALIGVAGIWRLRWWGVLLFALGVLLKPPVCVVAALLLMDPRRFSAWFKQALLIVIALVPTWYWYLVCNQYLASLQELPVIFALFADRHPLAWFMQFWTSARVLDMWSYHFVLHGGGLVAVLAWVSGKDYVYRRKMVLAFVVLLIQASIIGMLSNDHAGAHSYYLIGLAPTAALLAYQSWQLIRWRWLRIVFALSIVVHTGETMVADMLGFARGLTHRAQLSGWFAECAELRKKVPQAPWNQGQYWRTPILPYPLFDLCLGERGQSPVGEWGVFHRHETVPPGCQSVATTERLLLFQCHEGAKS